MKEKRLIVSMACGGNSRKYSEVTFPLMQKYAQKCGADFYCMFQEDEEYPYIGQQKYKYANLLNMYDRIMHIDADVLVRSTTPNLFDIVAPNEFAGVDEHRYANPLREMPYIDRHFELNQYGEMFPEFYINVGMYLFSKTHRNLFDNPGKLPTHYKEQTELNYRLHLYNHKVHLLPWNFNYMSLMEWAGVNKDDAFMIHYAGGWGGKNSDVILDMMKKDLK